MIYRFSKPIFFIIIAIIVVALSGCATTGNNPILAHNYNSTAVKAHDSGDSENALKYYELAIKADPSLGAAWRNRGVLYWKLNQHAKSYADFLKASQLGYKSTVNIYDIDYSLAQAAALAADVVAADFYALGEYDEALKWWKKAMAAYTWPIDFLRIGQTHVRRNDVAGAYKALEQWLEHYPRYAPYKESLELLLFADDRDSVRNAEEQAASKAEKSGDFLSAFKHYNKAYALTFPFSWEKKRQRSLISALIRTYQKAQPKPELPEEARRYQIQSQTHTFAGRDKKAIAAYKKLIDICPWFPEASFNQALLLDKLGRVALENKDSSARDFFSQAISLMKRYLEIAPNAPNIRTARDRIYEWEALGGKDTVQTKTKTTSTTKTWLGVEHRFITLRQINKVIIQRVFSGSPADKAGLKAGDFILQFEGQSVTGTSQFIKMIQSKNPGDQVEIIVEHDGRELGIHPILGSREFFVE